MSIDLSEFHDIFFEECYEGLAVMESGLLVLDNGLGGSPDTEEINAIFRAAHSIKGGGASFGFTDISEFTHVMETLLDEMRDARRAVTRPVVDLLLESVDCLRVMVDCARDGKDADRRRTADISQRLMEMLSTDGDQEQAETDERRAVEATEAHHPSTTGWRICFRPHAELLKTGNEPLRIFKELAGLGELSTQADISGLPAFGALEPDNCYLAWELELRGGASREQVLEIFDWADQASELEIVALSDPETVEVAQETTAPADDIRSSAAAADAAPAGTEAGSGGNTAGTAKAADKRTESVTGKESGSIRVAIDKVDALINLVGELVITQSMLSQIGACLEEVDTSQLDAMHDGLAQLERNTRELQESVLQIRMLPISFSFNRFPRLVRDIGSKTGKQIDLEITGEQTEVDKTVLEKIGDPLVHLVRNSVDHGLEKPQIRKAAGKPEAGRLELSARHEGGNIVIEVIDDGAGLDKDAIHSKAVEKGLVDGTEELSDEDICNLVFEPGFSTAKKVSDVSGRGVGMDVVRRNIRDLGGNVSIISHPGKGSRVTIQLPLTLAILDGQLVNVSGETYIVPVVSIIESLQIRPDCIYSISGQAELYLFREEYIPVIRLDRLFGMESGVAALRDGMLMVVESGGKQVGLSVDELMGQQQVVIKSLERNFRQIRGISGATILGDGTVALIMDIQGLIQRHFEQCTGQAGKIPAVA